MVVSAVAKLAVLFGAVTIGPTAPVCRANAPCDRPAGQVRLSFTRLGHVYATTTTATGAYRIRLAPGYYTVEADAGMALRPRRIHVRVPTTKLDFAIDTGIR